MCRFVQAVLFVSFLSCVLTEDLAPKNNNTLACVKNPGFITGRNDMRNCFDDAVDRHLHPDKVTPGKCENATDVSNQIDKYFKLPGELCNNSIKINTTFIKSLIAFSLQKDTFKEFYKTIDCVKKYEFNISNVCVKNNVGFFNITAERKHMSWGVRANVFFSENTCTKSKKVKNCVEELLKNCNQNAGQYVASLFDHVRAIGKCDQYNTTDTLPPIYTPGSAASTWLTTPVKITLGVGASVVGLAALIVLFLKCRDK